MVCIEIEYDEDGESSDNDDDDDDDDDEYGDEGCGVEQLRLEQIELGLRLRFTDEHTHQCDCLDDHDCDDDYDNAQSSTHHCDCGDDLVSRPTR